MICMLNCSYKGKGSNSRYFLGLLKKELERLSSDQCEMIDIKSVLTGDIEAFINKMSQMQALIIGAPLYVDGLPAQVIKMDIFDGCT